MSRMARVVGVIVLVVLGLGLGYIGWQMSYEPEMQACDACGRPIHEHSRSTGLVDGKTEFFCCPTCALTLHRQTGNDVQIIELTDYETGQPIEPASAFVVTESDLNLCMRHDVLRTQRTEAALLDFDRCSPSMIVFGSPSGAARFAEQHGGLVVPFGQLASQYAGPSSGVAPARNE